nr:hypothetical protein GTC16762_11730 [Pigmentibacter ruber]
MIIKNKSRRKFINFASKIRLVYASGLFGKELIGNGMNANALEADFFFLQLSDIHLGFKDNKINPFSDKTFKKSYRSGLTLSQWIMFQIQPLLVGRYKLNGSKMNLVN